jgi:glycosyltransferase involved in cell wall biosynthesis
MNIILVSAAPPYRGGISEHTKGLYNNLIKNHSVKIFSFYYQYPKILFPGKSQKINSYKEFDNTYYSINSINPFSWLKTTNAILKSNPDIVIFSYWNPFFAPCFGYIAKLLKNKIGSEKLISICHNIEPHEKSIVDKSLNKFYLKPFKKFMLMSSFVEDQLKIYKKNFNSLVRFLPITKSYITNLKKEDIKLEMGYDSNQKLILFFGLIRPYKGLDNLLHAVKNILLSDNIKLIIAGEAYESLGRYKSIIDQYNINNKVVWISSFISNDMIEKLMIISDLLVLPYKRASQSGVLSQAWQYNLPSIVTNVGGLSEYVDEGKSGYIVDSDNINQLDKKIVHFFSSNDLNDMPKYIQSNKHKFSWEYHIQGLLELANNES